MNHTFLHYFLSLKKCLFNVSVYNQKTNLVEEFIIEPVACAAGKPYLLSEAPPEKTFLLRAIKMMMTLPKNDRRNSRGTLRQKEKKNKKGKKKGEQGQQQQQQQKLP